MLAVMVAGFFPRWVLGVDALLEGSDYLSAYTTIETALDAGDSKAAVEVLKAVGLYGQVEPPGGPVDAELVLWEKSKEWALAEFNKKGPSLDPLLDMLVHDTEVARLTRHRMEELQQSAANDN